MKPTTPDTIDYVTIDAWGNTATATRSVIVAAPLSAAVISSSHRGQFACAPTMPQIYCFFVKF